MISVPVTESSQVSEARRQCMMVARDASFSETDAGRVAIVAVELASNVLKHGRGGELLVDIFEDVSGKGIELLAVDKGPGIADLEECLRDGYSSAGSPGTGLGAVVRLSQSHAVFSAPGLGTAVLARLQRGPDIPKNGGAMPAWGAICLPKPGEEAHGDGWAAVALPGTGCILMVADGLGHGPGAADASAAATRIFMNRTFDAPGSIVGAIHDGLRSTRGAAVAVARIDLVRSVVTFAGLGNIAGIVAGGPATRRMVSHNGTAGHTAHKIKEFEYPFASREQSVVILHSDGVGTGWALDRYPGLGTHHPALMAAVIYRDFNRGRDDATVLVAKVGSLQ